MNKTTKNSKKKSCQTLKYPENLSAPRGKLEGNQAISTEFKLYILWSAWNIVQDKCLELKDWNIGHRKFHKNSVMNERTAWIVNMIARSPIDPRVLFIKSLLENFVRLSINQSKVLEHRQIRRKMNMDQVLEKGAPILELFRWNTLRTGQLRVLKEFIIIFNVGKVRFAVN